MLHPSGYAQRERISNLARPERSVVEGRRKHSDYPVRRDALL